MNSLNTLVKLLADLPEEDYSLGYHAQKDGTFKVFLNAPAKSPVWETFEEWVKTHEEVGRMSKNIRGNREVVVHLKNKGA